MVMYEYRNQKTKLRLKTEPNWIEVENPNRPSPSLHIRFPTCNEYNSSQVPSM